MSERLNPAADRLMQEVEDAPSESSGEGNEVCIDAGDEVIRVLAVKMLTKIFRMWVAL